MFDMYPLYWIPSKEGIFYDKAPHYTIVYLFVIQSDADC